MKRSDETEIERLFKSLAQYALFIGWREADPIGVFDRVCVCLDKDIDIEDIRDRLIKLFRKRRSEYPWLVMLQEEV